MADKEPSPTRTQNPPDGGCKRLNYPAEWSDAERMHFLMAPFPPGSDLTPNNSKVKFWRSLILSSSKELLIAMAHIYFFCTIASNLPILLVI